MNDVVGLALAESYQKLACILVGDINIDLTKYSSSCDIAAYVDLLLMYNCLPTILMPTRVTSKSATLIDHIYYYEGLSTSSAYSVSSGNLLTDTSDHMSNYILIRDNNNNMKSSRLLVRIYSEKNNQNVLNNLYSDRWNAVYNESDVNVAYENFISNISQAFHNNFKLTKLSRKRSKDKGWIIGALKNSSKIENKLYKR